MPPSLASPANGAANPRALFPGLFFPPPWHSPDKAPGNPPPLSPGLFLGTPCKLLIYKGVFCTLAVRAVPGPGGGIYPQFFPGFSTDFRQSIYMLFHRIIHI